MTHEPTWNRRSFLKKSVLTAMTVALGTKIVYASNLRAGYIPLIFMQEENPLAIKVKGMLVLNERPWNIETPAHLLDDPITPTDKMFLRNNGLSPGQIDVASWTLTIDGEAVQAEKTYTLDDLKKRFKSHTYQLQLECGGNGRAGYYPPASGNQWQEGAVSCAEWTGVRLKDVLQDVGLKSNAVYIGYYGKDTHLSGDTNKVVISRGAPMAKALEDETLLAWAVNGKDIPIMHGHPLRLIVGGWPASISGKWLYKISVRDKIHDGPKMDGDSYRMPKNPLEPGAKVLDEDYKIIESMPVRSVITYPQSGATFDLSKKLEVRGHAWAGDLTVRKIQTSIDFGATWQMCELNSPKNRLAWQHWSTEVRFPSKGYYEIWAMATDSKGVSQPMVIPGWNPKGYLNNACHRIAVKVS